MTNLGVYRYEPRALARSYQELKGDAEAFINLSMPTAASTTRPTEHSHHSRRLVVAATQLTGANLPDSDVIGFCARAEQAIALAVTQTGANLVLLPELWSGPYFCQSQEAELLSLADPAVVEETPPTTTIDAAAQEGGGGGGDTTPPGWSTTTTNILLQRMQKFARHYQVVLPISFYERANNVLYNSVVVFDADGTYLGRYRKSHIPDGPGYQEKFYFSPGNGGSSSSISIPRMAGGVFDSEVLQCRIGVAICWDQWFPETARCLALQGCHVLLYPTAIGSEPQDPTIQSFDHWQRVMQGHAGANMIPVVASNRFGTEILLRRRRRGDGDDNEDYEEQQRIHFYGKSFITDNVGAIVAQCADNTNETPVVVVAATIDMEENQKQRLSWGLFRDRRPDLYQTLLTKDGRSQG